MGRFNPSGSSWQSGDQGSPGKGKTPWSPGKTPGKGKSTKGKTSGKGKYTNKSWTPQKTISKNSPSSGGWSTGKGSQTKQKWCEKTDKGQWYCFNWQAGKCNFGKNCRDSHNCPVDLGWGSACNKRHLAANHV